MTTEQWVRPPRTPAVELRTVLQRLVAAADSGRALDAFLHAAGAAQIVADRLQGTSALPAQPALRLLPPRGGIGALRRLLETSATAVRGRLGLSEWHVLLRDLANVLAEAVLGDTEEDAAGILLSVRTAVEDLRSGVPPHTARLLDGALLHVPSGFRDLDLRPEDAVALARRFAERHPDRERPLLVLGLRSSGGYLAPLVAAALGRLEYQHVVARTTRPGGPLLPRSPGCRTRCAGSAAWCCCSAPRRGPGRRWPRSPPASPTPDSPATGSSRPIRR